MPLISAQPGDVVVIVPRWLIAAVGLVMLLMGLTISFLFVFVGHATTALFFSVFVLMFVPLQLLIMYILWRFFWYFMILGALIPSVLFLTIVTGFVRLGSDTPFVRDALTGDPVFVMGDNLAVIVLLSFLMAFVLVMIIALVLRAFIGSPFPSRPGDYDIDELDRPRKRSVRRDLWKDDRPYPPPTDPYWDDK